MASQIEDEEIHKIFTSDPLHFKSLVDNYVEVETVSGKTEYKGILYTVDPVSETLVLLTPETDSLKVDLITSHNVKNIKIVESSSVPKIPDNLFKEDWAKHMSEEEIEKKRKALKEWLEKNTIPIVEKGKLLALDDVLTIEPPYGPDQCMSNNEIVLSKIQDLIKSIPSSDIPSSPSTAVSEDQIEQKRVKVKEWLLKNSIPIVESGKVLKLDDVLTINAPYGIDQCASDNEDVLGKIKHLIETMPV